MYAQTCVGHVCVDMFVDVCVHMYVNGHVVVGMHVAKCVDSQRTYAHTRTHAHTHARTHTHMHACMHACTHMHTHARVCTRMHANTRTDVWQTCLVGGIKTSSQLPEQQLAIQAEQLLKSSEPDNKVNIMANNDDDDDNGRQNRRSPTTRSTSWQG